jgi:putative ABC transport system permease protein
MQDFRYGLRSLLRSPGFSVAALLSLGLGIGANTAIFTLTNAVFLHPLPVREPARILELYTVDHATQTTAANLVRTGISIANITDIARQNEAFSGVAAYFPSGLALTGFGKPSQENGFVVSPNYFEVLGVPAAAGRTFDPSEDLSGPPRPEAVVSHDFAQRVFGSDAAAVGKTINLNAVAYTVLGVAPAAFRGTLSVGPNAPIWIPLGMHSQIFTGPLERLYNERRFRFLNVFARLKPGVEERQADANLQTVAARLEAAYPKDNRGRTFESAPLAEAALGFAGPRNQTVDATVALSVAVAFVLLIACANLANLSLARAAKRAREMGVRVALGAGRARLIRQLVSEAAILSAAGGVLGIAIGWAGAKLLWAARPGFLQNAWVDLNLDMRICLFTAGLSALSCLLFGIAPVIRASAPDLSKLLSTSGRGNVQAGGRSGLRAMLVVGEMALALVALVGAGLFIRSMQRAQNINLGFETKNLFVAGVNLGALQMKPDEGREFMRALVEKVKAVPGVASASVAGGAPLQGGLMLTAFREGDPVDSRQGVLTFAQPASSAYLDSMRIPLVEGRALNDFDRMGSAKVMVISQATARRIWPGQRAIGKRVHFATSNELYEVVGIARDSTAINIGEQPQMMAYMPFDQAYQPAAVLHVRTVGDPVRMIAPVTAAVQALNPELVLINPGSVHAVIAQALWAPRMAAILFGIFGVLGLVLAVIGVYGVMAYTVLQRTSEIGIRMAVGARQVNVMGMILGQSMKLALLGIGLGSCGALAITGPVRSLLFGVSPTDPVTFFTVAGILAATAMIAGGIPAWRASRIDPVRALGQE